MHPELQSYPGYIIRANRTSLVTNFADALKSAGNELPTANQKGHFLARATEMKPVHSCPLSGFETSVNWFQIESNFKAKLTRTNRDPPFPPCPPCFLSDYPLLCSSDGTCFRMRRFFLFF